MCVRVYSERVEVLRWANQLSIATPMPETIPEGERFPSGSIPLAWQDQDGMRFIEAATWGLQPSWASDPNFGRKHAYIARAETAAVKPSFRSAFAHRRGITPINAFWERADGRWLKITPGTGETMMVAAIFELPHGDAPVNSVALLTTDANLTIAKINDRMPVFLLAASWQRWLDPAAGAEELRHLLVPASAELFLIADDGPIGRSAPKPKREMQADLFSS